MQIVHDTLAKKKPMEVVEKDGQETLKNFNADEALDNLEQTEEVETTQENVEETQQTEEPEEVREVQATEETDEPEEASPKKKSRLQRRIDELVRERAAATEDRNKLYGQVQQLSQELQSKTALNKDYSSLQKDYYDSQMEAANNSLVSARTNYKMAYEAGDSDKMLEVAESIADAKVKVNLLENQKHMFKDKVEDEPRAPIQQSVQQQAPQQPTQQPDPRALQWAQKNTWFGDNAARTGAAYAIDAQLKMEGFNPSSEEYYSELDLRLGESFSDLSETGTKPKQVVASVSRAPSASNKKVKLSNSQIAMARKLGVPTQEYAKFVRNTNDQ